METGNITSFGTKKWLKRPISSVSVVVISSKPPTPQRMNLRRELALNAGAIASAE